MKKKMNREAWLTEGIKQLRPIFKRNQYTFPDKVRVSCGFPKGSRGGKKAIGQCWTRKCSKSGYFEIFISPVVADSFKALEVLSHEMVHATVGIKAGHKGPFKRCALAIGLEGKMTATTAGQDLAPVLNDIAVILGPYPHDELNPSAESTIKKQGTRLIKAKCPTDDYTVRITKKWIDFGLPTCPCGKQMEVEGGTD